jgi:hypothetical protein
MSLLAPVTDLPQETNCPLLLSESVRVVFNQDGASLLDVEQGLCFTMNAVGASIWRMLKAQQTISQITAQLVSDFGLPEDELRSDVLAFVSQLKERNLVLDPRDSMTEGGKRPRLVAKLWGALHIPRWFGSSERQ